MRFLWLLLLVACRPAAMPAESLRLVGFQQAAASGVLLNENLVFYFSDELDPSSVTPSSARVLDRNGRLVDGELRAEGNRLVFVPALARQANLFDGGFVPGSAYRVELTGFPVIAGLRSLQGLVLERGYSSQFRAVEAKQEGSLWLDPSPETAAALFLSDAEVGVSAPIVLRCAEPVDPRSVSSARFELRFDPDDGELVEVPLRAQLVVNSMQAGAEIELRAVESLETGLPRPLEPGTYHLWVREGVLDLGGQQVASSWAVTQMPARLEVTLQPEVAGNRSTRIEFLDTLMASPEEVPGVEGALVWDGQGFLRAGLMRAAGTGREGSVVWEPAAKLERDLHTVRFTLPERVQLDLSEHTGGVSVRAQGSLRIEGELLRHASSPELHRGPDESWAEWYGRRRGALALQELRLPQGVGLDDWMAAERGREWTALIAGGDLLIEGDIRVDGPLLLAAGGRIRVGGTIEASEVWTLGVGGGARVLPPARPAGLRVAAPTENPLSEPLRYGQLSAPFRPTGEPIRWRSAAVGAHTGAGGVRVLYLGERDQPDGTTARIGPVEDAALLDRCEALRLWFELELRPSAAWDPPMVDFVEVRWTEDTDR